MHAACLTSTHNVHVSPPPFLVLLSLSVSLMLSLLLSYFHTLCTPVPLLVPTSSTVPPRATTRPRVTWLCGCTCTQPHTVAHDRRTAPECGCGVPTELRVRTTVPRTHHSVPHSCLAFSCDRSSAGIRVLIHRIDFSHPSLRPPSLSRSGRRVVSRQRWSGGLRHHDASSKTGIQR